MTFAVLYAMTAVATWGWCVWTTHKSRHADKFDQADRGMALFSGWAFGLLWPFFWLIVCGAMFWVWIFNIDSEENRSRTGRRDV